MECHKIDREHVQNAFITCSPKIPPHIKNDGLMSFRRI